MNLSDKPKEFVDSIDSERIVACGCWNENPYICWVDRSEYYGQLDEGEIEEAGGPCQCTCHQEHWDAVMDEGWGNG